MVIPDGYDELGKKPYHVIRRKKYGFRDLLRMSIQIA